MAQCSHTRGVAVRCVGYWPARSQWTASPPLKGKPRMVAVSSINMTTDKVVEVSTTPVLLLPQNLNAIYRKVFPSHTDLIIWIGRDNPTVTSVSGEPVALSRAFEERAVGQQSAIFQGEVWAVTNVGVAPIDVVVQEGENSTG